MVCNLGKTALYRGPVQVVPLAEAQTKSGAYLEVARCTLFIIRGATDVINGA